MSARLVPGALGTWCELSCASTRGPAIQSRQAKNQTPNFTTPVEESRAQLLLPIMKYPDRNRFASILNFARVVFRSCSFHCTVGSRKCPVELSTAHETAAG